MNIILLCWLINYLRRAGSVIIVFSLQLSACRVDIWKIYKQIFDLHSSLPGALLFSVIDSVCLYVYVSVCLSILRNRTNATFFVL